MTTIQTAPPPRRSLSLNVRRGLSTLAGLVRASSPEEILGFNHPIGKSLSKEEKASLENVEAALEWIEHINAKKAAELKRR